jgi:site-specific recombinase XerD
MSANTPPHRQRLATVREVCEEYLARDDTALHGASRANLVATVKEFMAAKGNIAVTDLIGDDLEKWIEEHPAWKSPWTRMRVAGNVKRAFSWAWRKGLIASPPFMGVSYPAGEAREPMSEEHFRMLLRDTSVEFRRALLFLWWTGCRPCEMSALQWDFIDAENCIAVLKNHKTKHSRKDRAPRIICLPEKAIRLLTWLLYHQRPDQAFVFVNYRQQPWSRNALSLRVWRMRERLGIPANVYLYGCRHSFGTRMCLAGVDLKTVATLLGHTTTRMAEHYTHLAGETKHLREKLEKGLKNKKDQQ